MHVVEHQPDLVGQRRQVGQQALGELPAVEIRCRRQCPYQRRSRDGAAQSVEHRQPEPLWIAPDRDPRDVLTDARFLDP
ncbi:hypothetical protein [Kibdelosporangium phytohabitans]|uniref:Uncharacterized protein n=1 Tax=Kibdelosporangium phytohabitans TaxID=860235 RepID=A0A0N9HR92_9PSEU|nr:hypothetical protein [Kibdelosporangium phytohabitans]ALG09708.1 hypothetical protein AOZ06_24885 [Kibdelosporangium phytohabitans]MBE1468936.1 hypothetical protein [Kibdelosporangium phytohabitans]